MFNASLHHHVILKFDWRGIIVSWNSVHSYTSFFHTHISYPSFAGYFYCIFELCIYKSWTCRVSICPFLFSTCSISNIGSMLYDQVYVIAIQTCKSYCKISFYMLRLLIIQLVIIVRLFAKPTKKDPITGLNTAGASNKREIGETSAKHRACDSSL